MTMIKGNSKRRERAFPLRPFACVAFSLLAILFLASIVLKSGPTSSDHEVLSMTHVAQVDQKVVDGTVSVPGNGREVPYLHCGPRHTASYGKGTGHAELVLLHGAKFTAEDWRTSLIMEKLCKDAKDRPGFSVTALNLPVNADGSVLVDVFHTLVKGRVLSGDPAVFITPSASGKAMITLDIAIGEGKQLSSIQQMVKMWIPVACGGVLKADDNELRLYAVVPVLAIYGDKDPIVGKSSSERLSKLVGAESFELPGSHPVYLDSPDHFVETIRSRV